MPVVTNAPSQVKTTVYVHKGVDALVVLASFYAGPLNVTLTFDWQALGLSASAVKLYAPAMQPFQPTASVFAVGQTIQVPASQGWIFWLKP